jgi:hypothetical protein
MLALKELKDRWVIKETKVLKVMREQLELKDLLV